MQARNVPSATSGMIEAAAERKLGPRNAWAMPGDSTLSPITHGTPMASRSDALVRIRSRAASGPPRSQSRTAMGNIAMWMTIINRVMVWVVKSTATE